MRFRMFSGVFLVFLSAGAMERGDGLTVDSFKLLLEEVLEGKSSLSLLQDGLERTGYSLEWFIRYVVDESAFFPESFYFVDERNVLAGHGITVLAFSPDSKKLAWSGRGVCKAEWQNLVTGEIQEVLCNEELRDFVPLSLSFEPEFQEILLGMNDGRLFYQQGSRFLYTEPPFGTGERVSSCAVSDDGHLCAYSHSSSLFIWERSSGEHVESIQLNKYYDEIQALRFLTSDKLMIWTREGDALIWDADSNDFLDFCTQTPCVRCAIALAESSNGRYFAARSMRGDIVIYNLEIEVLSDLWHCLGRTYPGAYSLAFDPQGSFIGYIAGGRFFLRNQNTSLITQVISNLSNSLSSLAFSSDGQYLALGSREGRLMLLKRCGKELLTGLTLEQIIFILRCNKTRCYNIKVAEIFNDFPKCTKAFLESVLL